MELKDHVLFSTHQKNEAMKKGKNKLACFLLLLLCCLELLSQDNGKALSLDDCVSLAYTNNEQLKVADLETRYLRKMKTAAFDLPKTTIMFTQGQFNSIYKYDNNITVAQAFPFPTVLGGQSKLAGLQVKSSEFKTGTVKAELKLKVKEAFYLLQYSTRLLQMIRHEDSIYDFLMRMENVKALTSEKDNLEMATTLSQSYLIKSHLIEAEQQIQNNKIALQVLMRAEEAPQIEISSLRLPGKVVDSLMRRSADHPHLLYLKEQMNIAGSIRKLEAAKVMPDLMVGYFNQSIYGPANIFGSDYFLTTANRLQGFQVGVAIPLQFSAHHARVVAAEIQQEIAKDHFKYGEAEMEGKYKQAVNKYLVTKRTIEHYDKFMLKSAQTMISQSLAAFNKKEINYIEYLAIISKSLEIERNYLQLVLQNNLAVAEIEYFLSK
jgi:heavy metal efflux system protein